jgi:hypothetical protein
MSLQDLFARMVRLVFCLFARMEYLEFCIFARMVCLVFCLFARMECLVFCLFARMECLVFCLFFFCPHGVLSILSFCPHGVLSIPSSFRFSVVSLFLTTLASLPYFNVAVVLLCIFNLFLIAFAVNDICVTSIFGLMPESRHCTLNCSSEYRRTVIFVDYYWCNIYRIWYY